MASVGRHQHVDGQCLTVVARHTAGEGQVLITFGRQLHLSIVIVLGGIGGKGDDLRRGGVHAQGTVVVIGDIPFFIAVDGPECQRAGGEGSRRGIEEGLLRLEVVFHILLRGSRSRIVGHVPILRCLRILHIVRKVPCSQRHLFGMYLNGAAEAKS